MGVKISGKSVCVHDTMRWWWLRCFLRAPPPAEGKEDKEDKDKDSSVVLVARDDLVAQLKAAVTEAVAETANAEDPGETRTRGRSAHRLDAVASL